MTKRDSSLMSLMAALALTGLPAMAQQYPVVDTGQINCYDASGEIVCPAAGEPFYGQDAQFAGIQMQYLNNGDGTIDDLNTGLMWQQVPSESKLGWADAQSSWESLSLADHDDWRPPSLKELFSISDFETGWPYIDTTYFSLTQTPDANQQQYWSSNFYEVGTTHGGAPSAIGVNHGAGAVRFDTKVEGGPLGEGGERDYNFVRCVRNE